MPAGCGIVSQNHASVKLQPGQALLINCRTPQSYGTDPDTGFSDDASFNTRFSATAGISPSRYRKDAITRKQVSQSADTEKTDV